MQTQQTTNDEVRVLTDAKMKGLRGGSCIPQPGPDGNRIVWRTWEEFLDELGPLSDVTKPGLATRTDPR